jgi:signal transduction histidine kinase
VRRIGVMLALVLALSGLGTATLISRVLGRFGLGGSSAAVELGLSLFLVALIFVVFLNVMRRVGSPLGDVVAAADRVARGDLSTRLQEKGPRSLRGVARAFNSMTGQLAAQDQKRRDLLADIAHELRTPLAVVEGRLEGLLDGVYPRDDAHLEELLGETRVLARLVEDLGTFAHAERGTLALQKERTELAPLLHDAARSMAAESTTRGVTVSVDEPLDLPAVEIDAVRVREVLLNLISNAVRHTAPGTRVRLDARASGREIVIRVHDTGPGIAPEDLSRVFDRFQKGAGSQGSGLGLSIASSLVRAHGGEISVASEPGRGTTVTFTLPLSPVA